ncbi:MAG: hypothetical protein ACOYLQ_14010 [Hyphomicrobiaceae bacterium]|jgi:hypothetical protein
MAFEVLTAEIGLLFTQMENEREPEDRHEIYMQIARRLSELKAYGLPLPQDLVALEAALEAEFASEMPPGSETT